MQLKTIILKNINLTAFLLGVIFTANAQKVKIDGVAVVVGENIVLDSDIDKFKKDLFNFRFQKINSQITNPAKIGETKKTIARLKTNLKGKN